MRVKGTRRAIKRKTETRQNGKARTEKDRRGFGERKLARGSVGKQFAKRFPFARRKQNGDLL